MSQTNEHGNLGNIVADGLHASTRMRVDGLHASTWMRVATVLFLFNPKASPLPPAPSGDQLAVDLQTERIPRNRKLVCRVEIN